MTEAGMVRVDMSSRVVRATAMGGAGLRAPDWRRLLGAGSVAAIDFTPFLTHL